MQVLVVTFTWLFVAPTLTCWLWRLAFVRSFQQVRPASKCALLHDVYTKATSVQDQSCKFGALSRLGLCRASPP